MDKMNRLDAIRYILYIIETVPITSEEEGLVTLTPIFADRHAKINRRFIRDLIILKGMFQSIVDIYNSPDMMDVFMDTLQKSLMTGDLEIPEDLPEVFPQFYMLLMNVIDDLLQYNIPREGKEGRHYQITHALDLKDVSSVVIKYDYMFMGVLRYTLNVDVPVSSLDVLPNGNVLVGHDISAASQGTAPALSILDARTGKRLLEYNNGSLPMSHLILSQNKIITAYLSNEIVMWNPLTGKTLFQFEKIHQQQRISVARLSDTRFVSMSPDRLVIWDLDEPLFIIESLESFYKLEVSSKGSIITLARNSVIRTWDSNTGDQQNVIQLINPISKIKVVNNKLFVITYDRLTCLDPDSLEEKYIIIQDTKNIYPISQSIAAITSSRSITLINTHTGESVRNIAISGTVLALSFEQSIMVGTEKDQLIVFDMNGTQKNIIEGPSHKPINRLINLPDGAIMSTDSRGTISVWK